LRYRKLPSQLLQTYEAKGLKKEDILFIAEVIKKTSEERGIQSCWNVESVKLSFLQPKALSLSSTHHSIPFYKGRDIRPLLLAVFECYATPTQRYIIRRSNCSCKYCINPNHYFFGDSIDLRVEKWKRKGHQINKEIYLAILKRRKEDPHQNTYKYLSECFRLKEHIVRAICVSK